MPNHILIKQDASRSALLEDFMIRHAKMLGLNNSSDLKLLQQLKIEEIARFGLLQK